MGGFLRENWVWILAPIVVVGVLVLAAVLFLDGDTPFSYAIF